MVERACLDDQRHTPASPETGQLRGSGHRDTVVGVRLADMMRIKRWVALRKGEDSHRRGVT
jgi:hypothetical protein